MKRFIYHNGHYDIQFGSTIKSVMSTHLCRFMLPDELAKLEEYDQIFYRVTPYLEIGYAIKKDGFRVDLPGAILFGIQHLFSVIDQLPDLPTPNTPVAPGSASKAYSGVFVSDLFRSSFIYKIVTVAGTTTKISRVMLQLHIYLQAGYNIFDVLDSLSELYKIYTKDNHVPAIVKKDLDDLYTVLSNQKIEKIDLEKWRYSFPI